MKKIIAIIVVIILFIISGLVLWSGIFPESFSNFFKDCPVFCNYFNSNLAIVKMESGKFFIATTSESIKSSSGQITIKNNTWSVEIARTDAERESGLSNRRTLFSKNGMLFVFDKSEKHTFWMKDMIIPIDMIFFDDQWKIISIEKSLSPQSAPKIFGAEVKSRYVLEINANEADSFGLSVGDRAIFLNK